MGEHAEPRGGDPGIAFLVIARPSVVRGMISYPTVTECANGLAHRQNLVQRAERMYHVGGSAC